jgi:hypothetical protein
MKFMYRHKTNRTQPIARHPAYRRAIQKVNEAFERVAEGSWPLSDDEKRRRIRELFGLKPI